MAKLAESHAVKCIGLSKPTVILREWEHNKQTKYGENMAYNAQFDGSEQKAIEYLVGDISSFANEQKHYHYGRQQCSTGVTSHYTAVRKYAHF